MEQPTGGPRQTRAPARREPGTWRIGQIAGVDVLVRSSWLLVAAFIAVLSAPSIDIVAPGIGGWTYVAGLAFAVLLYLSVLLHEASHALMAQHYGLPVASITLHFLGGVTEIEGEPDTPRREFAVSVVGPLTSLGVALVFYVVDVAMPDHGLAWLAVRMLWGSNAVVGVLNLVPGLPLDGGRVLRAAVWRATGNPHRGTIVAAWGGRACAGLAIAYPFLSQIWTHQLPPVSTYVLAFVIALFLWSGASSALASAQVRRRLPALQARLLARRALAVPEDLSLAEAVRRAHEQQAGSIVVTGPDGRPSGIVNEAAAQATPQDRWPWLPVSAVARSIEPEITFPADLAGEPLILAMQRAPATEYLLLEPDGSVYGVLVSADVDRAFAAEA